MAFHVLRTGVPLVLGMPFFDRFETHVLWRRREYLIYDGCTTHVLRADLIPRAYGPAASHLFLTNLPPSGDDCCFTAANVDATIIVSST